jgi:hypothetical protein
MLRNSHHLTYASAVKLSALALGLGIGLLPFATASAVADDAPQTSVTTPNTNRVRANGLKTAIVAATDTGGNIDLAWRALKATHAAFANEPGYILMSSDKVVKSLKNSGYRWPFAPNQYPEIQKRLQKVQRGVSVEVSPVDGSENTRKAVVELFDFSNGGLVGYGEAIYTANEDSQALVADNETNLEALAVDGAILRAVAELNKPAEVRGIIVSLPTGHQTRLSKGLRQGLRTGTRIEYIVNDNVVARGSVIDVGEAEAIATVAPESAYPLLSINGEFRTVKIPNIGIAGKSITEKNEKEWKRFELEAGLAAGIAGLGYLLFTH